MDKLMKLKTRHLKLNFFFGIEKYLTAFFLKEAASFSQIMRYMRVSMGLTV